MNTRLLFMFRVVMALVWLYNGLWLKWMLLDPRHLYIVSGPAAAVGLNPGQALQAIGVAETALALLILSGFQYRWVNGMQIAALLGMNVAGILFGGGSIQDPAGLIVSNLPLIACAVAVIVAGPGSPAPETGKRHGC